MQVQDALSRRRQVDTLQPKVLEPVLWVNNKDFDHKLEIVVGENNTKVLLYMKKDQVPTIEKLVLPSEFDYSKDKNLEFVLGN